METTKQEYIEKQPVATYVISSRYYALRESQRLDARSPKDTLAKSAIHLSFLTKHAFQESSLVRCFFSNGKDEYGMRFWTREYDAAF
ncbi:hypothetical protein CEXT_800281 [Caerostris extrusa]|uniref:Uncharacterized protein n=1 Tax=Caerostris extrusa TaxID=172846 RepID=A0AAV4XQG3_CAEEX|nr:hypothetical protein CEXT_800281 [Caerostris extrusa]